MDMAILPYLKRGFHCRFSLQPIFHRINVPREQHRIPLQLGSTGTPQNKPLTHRPFACVTAHMRNFNVVPIAALLLAAPCFADSIIIGNCNGCGVAGPYGTITLTQVGSDVHISIDANAGFSWKTRDGSDIEFNPTVAITKSQIEASDLTVGDVSSTDQNVLGFTETPFTFATNQTVGGNAFGVDLQGIGTGDSAYDSVASVVNWNFIIKNVTTAQLEGTDSTGVSWGLHTCAGPAPGCAVNTFFATPGTTSVPDGGSTSILLGSSLVGFGLLRRRLNSR